MTPKTYQIELLTYEAKLVEDQKTPEATTESTIKAIFQEGLNARLMLEPEITNPFETAHGCIATWETALRQIDDAKARKALQPYLTALKKDLKIFENMAERVIPREKPVEQPETTAADDVPITGKVEDPEA